MRILLTNDDGIHAPGLEVLERIAAELSDDVWVVAPELDQSGLSHSLSLNDPLRLRQVSERRFALRGTPSDCIIMAVRRICADHKPDLVLSGVNSGQNVADDVTYSGTIAGAIEGTLLGIPSIALEPGLSARRAGAHSLRDVASRMRPASSGSSSISAFPDNVLYNVNFPNRAPDAVDGVMITTQGKLVHGLHIDERFDGRGNQYFWLAYRRTAAEHRAGLRPACARARRHLGDAAPARHDRP